MQFVAGGKLEKPRAKPTQAQFRPPRNQHGGIATRTRGPAVTGVRLTSCATAPRLLL